MATDEHAAAMLLDLRNMADSLAMAEAAIGYSYGSMVALLLIIHMAPNTPDAELIAMLEAT